MLLLGEELKMKMTIDESIKELEILKKNTFSYMPAYQAFTTAVNIMRKYQQIEQIMKSKKMNTLNIGILIPKDMACVLHEIKEVIEDEKID